eukprot:CAMPEP_0113525568 /NCGR_PEP_ID=MMETSP0015_2-20120614/237_1 /TAXON_ID=2838 /ORGANISM="Odontella" /LENGTH=314 /DNA_ID=CAMNT_0000423755 /DNA_START=63 /DNA_END=1003 /DNA_ORIENTATION=+ /assembly_acc=CAM_ASM_000160
MSHRNGVLVRDKIISASECAELVAAHQAEIHAGYIQSLTVTRLADLVLPRTIHLALPLLRARHRVLEIAEEYFGMELELLPEFTALTGWHKGSFLRSHYDANRDYLKHRAVSAILYLNGQESGETDEVGSFTGGELVFEPSDVAPELTVVPLAGRLVCFRSSAENVHRVEKVTSGIRYSLTLWFTTTSHAEEADSCGLLSSAGPLAIADAIGNVAEVPQPWETQSQATSLLDDIMVAASISSEEERQRMCRICQASSLQILRHIVAFSHWQYFGCKLGELTECEMLTIADSWRSYVRRSRKSLSKAAARWRDNG